MKRRNALKQIGAGITAGVLLPSWLSSCVDKDPGPEIKYDGTVAIIGAGAAGLYAADILLSKGIHVKLFEASSRAGGRARNLATFDVPDEALQFDPEEYPNSDFPTELGAERIQGSDSSFASIVNQLNVPYSIFSNTTTDGYWLGGIFVVRADALLDADFMAADNYFQTLSSYSGADISVQQHIQSQGLSTRVQAILNSWIGNNYGTSNDRLGIKALAADLKLQTRDNQQLILKSNPVKDVLLSRFSDAVSKTQFNTVITSIDYAGDKIILNGEKITNGAPESFSETVDKVVVAVPVSVLKQNMITFTPALPSTKIAALSKMEMDASMRIVLEYKKNFWGVQTGFIFGGIESPEYFNAGVDRSRYSKTMNVTINGPKAEELSALTKNEVIEKVLAELDLIFPDKQASANLRRNGDGVPVAVIMDWSKEKYIKGGIAHVKPGGSHQDRINLGSPISKKIFFAGEATAIKGDFGTVSGALDSAERTAEEVVDAILKP